MSKTCQRTGKPWGWNDYSRSVVVFVTTTGTGWATGIILERYGAIQFCVGDTVAEAILFDFGSIFLVDSW
jgi:hypothetical protein